MFLCQVCSGALHVINKTYVVFIFFETIGNHRAFFNILMFIPTHCPFLTSFTNAEMFVRTNFLIISATIMLNLSLI